MGYGFAAFNDDHKFLISDNFENLHFLGKASVVPNGLPNSAHSIEDTAFSTGTITPPATNCSTMPSPPFSDAGGSGQSNIAYRVFDGNTNRNPGGNWPDMSSTQYAKASWCWVDLQCAQEVESFTLHMDRYASSPTCKVFYGDSGSPYFIDYGGTPGSNISYDNEMNISGSSAEYPNGWTRTIPTNTKLPHRYWAFQFPIPWNPYPNPKLKEIVINFSSTPSGQAFEITQPNSLNDRAVFEYTIESLDTPLVFIKPEDTSRWHALIKQENTSGNTWVFQVLVSGPNNIPPPQLYCFATAEAVEASSETHGMVVKKNNGTTTFDSRLKPLVLVDGGSSVAPSLPSNDGVSSDLSYLASESHITQDVHPGASTIHITSTASLPNAGSAVLHGYNRDPGTLNGITGTKRNNIQWTGKTPTSLTGVTGVTSGFVYSYSTYYGWSNNYVVRDKAYITPSDNEFISSSFDFKSHEAQTYNSSALQTSVARENLMFAAPSLAQSVASKWSQTYFDYIITSWYNGSILSRSQVYKNMFWWVMYREAFRINSNTFDKGWNTWLSGLLYSEEAKTSTWRGSGATNTTVGEAPYVDKTINLQDNAYLLADASKYE